MTVEAVHTHRPPRTNGFAETMREPQTPFISPERLSKTLGVPTQALAELAGVHRNTLRNPASDRLLARLREIVKATGAAADVTGDVGKSIFWYRNEPIADYRYRTAAELVADGQLDAVLASIEDLADCASG